MAPSERLLMTRVVSPFTSPQGHDHVGQEPQCIRSHGDPGAIQHVYGYVGMSASMGAAGTWVPCQV